MGTLNSYIRGALAARQLAAQMEELLGARQQRTIQQQQAQRAEELFPLQKQRAEQELDLFSTQKKQAELGLERGQEELSGLKLQNQKLKKVLEQFTDPSVFEGLRKEVESLDLTPEEKVGFDIALQESAQSFDLTPARTYVKDIILERGRNKRSETSQKAIEERLTRQIDAADRRFFAGLSERQRQFQERAGSEEDAELAAQRIATGQAKLTDFSVNARNKIIRKLQGFKIVPPKVREELVKVDQAESIVDQFEKSLLDFVEDKSAKNAFRLSVQRNAFARKLGRALGEVGVFTDQDKADFARLISPGGVPIAAVSEDISFQAIQDIRELFNSVRERQLSGAFKAFPDSPQNDESKKRRIKVDSQGNVIE